jgi:hypothetical protein
MGSRGKLREVFGRPRATAWIGMRLTPREKASVREAAQRVGKGMSAYLLALHRFAVGKEK